MDYETGIRLDRLDAELEEIKQQNILILQKLRPELFEKKGGK